MRNEDKTRSAAAGASHTEGIRRAFVLQTLLTWLTWHCDTPQATDTLIDYAYSKGVLYCSSVPSWDSVISSLTLRHLGCCDFSAACHGGGHAEGCAGCLTDDRVSFLASKPRPTISTLCSQPPHPLIQAVTTRLILAPICPSSFSE